MRMVNDGYLRRDGEKEKVYLFINFDFYKLNNQKKKKAKVWSDGKERQQCGKDSEGRKEGWRNSCKENGEEEC